MALLIRVSDITFKMGIKATIAPIREAIRYHIEMADDFIDSALDQYCSRKDIAANQAEIHITAAELVLEYGIDSVQYDAHCVAHNIDAYSEAEIERRRLEDLADRDPNPEC